MIKVVKNYRSKSDKGTEHKVPKKFRAQELRTRLCRALGSKVEQSGLYASIASLQVYFAATRILVRAQVWKGIRGLCAPRQKFRAPGLKRTLVWVPEHGKKARKLPVCEIATRSNNRTCHSGEPGKIRKSHTKNLSTSNIRN